MFCFVKKKKVIIKILHAVRALPISKGLFHSFGKYFKIKEVVMTTSTWLSTWPAIN